MTLPVALTIAGSDSGAGAGIQADLKTFASFGVYGVTVITAITAQNTLGVRAVQDVNADVITAQVDAVAEDFAIAALKTGMLSSAAIIETVAAAIQRHRLGPVVVDPVMIAKSGDRLLREDAVDALRRRLLPLAEVVTPNIPEAEVLAGGHRAARIVTTSTHGTGCTFSAAITAGLAAGLDLPYAVAEARDYLSRALASAPGLGHGHGPLNHFSSLQVAHAHR